MVQRLKNMGELNILGRRFKYIAVFKDGTLIYDTIPKEAIKAYLGFKYLEENN